MGRRAIGRAIGTFVEGITAKTVHSPISRLQDVSWAPESVFSRFNLPTEFQTGVFARGPRSPMSKVGLWAAEGVRI